MKQWYEELYENSGETYDKELFTQGTAGEVEFLLDELNDDDFEMLVIAEK